MDSGGVGQIRATFWPTHVGLYSAELGEPWQHPGYARRQIIWDTTGPQIVGRAEPILVPPGDYTHLVLSHHPTSPIIMAMSQFAHPLHLDVAGDIRLDHITESDFAPAAPC
jgi:hypothetical protein